MSLPYRHNFKWNINELLSLQREYELLEMTIQDIADKHERTVDAILYRLQQEEFIETWVDARGYQEYCKNLVFVAGSLDTGVDPYDYGEDTETCDDVKDSDYEDEDEDEDEDLDDYYISEEEYEDSGTTNNISTLNQRVWGLETAVSDIKYMIGTLLSRFSTVKPLKKLRQSKTEVSAEI